MRQSSRSQPNKQPTGEPPTRVWLVLVMVVVGLAAYADSLWGTFILDDYKHIVLNEQIRECGFDNLVELLSFGRRPVINLTLALNYQLGRLNPFGYHALNIIIHLLAGMTLFGIVRRTLLLKQFRSDYAEAAPWLALAVASLWTVHPLQTQSVTYVIQRGEALMGLFYLLTLYCTLRGATAGRSWWWYLAAVAACALGMGCKAVIATAPVVVLLFDWLFLTGSFREVLQRRWGLYLALAATWSLLLGVGVIQGVFFPAPTAVATMGFAYQGITPLEYLLTQPGVLLHYLRLSIVPYPLCLDYQWPVAKTAAAIIPPTIVVIGLLVGTLWAVWRRHWIGFLGSGSLLFSLRLPVSSRSRMLLSSIACTCRWPPCWSWSPWRHTVLRACSGVACLSPV